MSITDALTRVTQFQYDTADRLTRQLLPDLRGIGPNATAYSYNRDKQLTWIARPDGINVDLGYDPAGRLASVTIPRGSIAFGYGPSSGNLTSLTSPDGVSLAYAYDGSLPTQESWSGPIAGSVSLSYDSNFRPVSQSVNGGSTVAFGYDADGLLTSAGALGFTREPANGLLTTTTLGSITTAQS